MVDGDQQVCHKENLELVNNMANNNENMVTELEHNMGITNEDIVNLPIKMSPVQIQQEYFENLGDCDWVK